MCAPRVSFNFLLLGWLLDALLLPIYARRLDLSRGGGDWEQTPSLSLSLSQLAAGWLLAGCWLAGFVPHEIPDNRTLSIITNSFQNHGMRGLLVLAESPHQVNNKHTYINKQLHNKENTHTHT